MTGPALKERISRAKLTARELQMIELLMGDMGSTVFLSGQQMASYCGVSATSMTRLVHKLGYEKFGEFKTEFELLYREMITPFDMFESAMEQTTESELIEESVKNDYINLSSMENSIDEALLHIVAEKIEKARKIYIIGMYSSETVVRAFGHYLWRLGKDYHEITGLGLFNKFEYSDIQHGDVLIAISTQRIVKEVLACVELAKRTGITTVAFTDNCTNPLASAADYTLLAPVRGVALDCTHVATIALVNILCNIIAAEIPDVVEANLQHESNKCTNKELFVL